MSAPRFYVVKHDETGRILAHCAGIDPETGAPLWQASRDDALELTADAAEIMAADLCQYAAHRGQMVRFAPIDTRQPPATFIADHEGNDQ